MHHCIDWKSEVQIATIHKVLCIGACVFIRSSIIERLLSVKMATLIFISERGSAISSAKQGKSGSIYKLVKK